MTAKQKGTENNEAFNGAIADSCPSNSNSNLNSLKLLNDYTPIIITPLPMNILQQLQKSNNVMTSSSTASNDISPALLQADKNPTILTPEEKRQRRLWRNRIAAKECRKKKKLYIHDMEGTIERLTRENKDLRKQVEELKRQVLNTPVLDENDRLIKEVEKLNAQLQG